MKKLTMLTFVLLMVLVGTAAAQSAPAGGTTTFGGWGNGTAVYGPDGSFYNSDSIGPGRSKGKGLWNNKDSKVRRVYKHRPRGGVGGSIIWKKTPYGREHANKWDIKSGPTNESLEYGNRPGFRYHYLRR